MVSTRLAPGMGLPSVMPESSTDVIVGLPPAGMSSPPKVRLAAFSESASGPSVTFLSVISSPEPDLLSYLTISEDLPVESYLDTSKKLRARLAAGDTAGLEEAVSILEAGVSGL